MAQERPVLPPRPYTASNFPASTASAKQMQVLHISKDARQVSYTHDVNYVTRDGVRLTLQLLAPKETARKLPCIVYVQGSAWRKQDVYANLPQLAEFAKRGYVVAIVEYRPTSVAKFPAQLQDAKTAIRFLRAHAETYHVDPDNIFVWGDSSGGHTALLVGLTEGQAALDTQDLNQYSAHVNAVVDFYGPTDITQMNLEPSTLDHLSPDSPEGLLLGGKNVLEHRAEAALTNPIHYVQDARQAAPILLMHGSKDRIVPFQQSALMAEALASKNCRYQFYQLAGADHGSSEFWTKEAFDTVEAFLKQYLHSGH